MASGIPKLRWRKVIVAVGLGAITTLTVCVWSAKPILHPLARALRDFPRWEASVDKDQAAMIHENAARACSLPLIKERLGEPVRPDETKVKISNYLEGDHGDAEANVPLLGNRRQGLLYIEATKTKGRWAAKALSMQVDGSTERVDLLQPRSPIKE